jgi:hypothetical protein
VSDLYGVVKIRGNNTKEGQTSIDFLTGMTLFILTLLFALNFMFGMVQPYTSTSGDSIQVADRVSDRMYTDLLTSSGQPPGYFNYGNVSEFFENTSEDEIRDKLGLSDVNNYNLTVSSEYTSYGTRDGLIAYWPFNERRSEQANDVAGPFGERLHGEIEGNVTTDVRGISSSGAYRFNNAEAAVNVTNDTDLNPADTGNMTLSAWVKREGSSPDEFQTIAAKGKDNGYQVHLQNGRPTFEKGSGAEAQANMVLNEGEWYHIAAVYNSTASDELKVYVNARSDPSWEGSDTIAAAPGDNFGIGKNVNRTADPDDRYFDGVIDEVRLYDRALSQNEITELYESAGVLSPDKPSPGSPLVNTTYTLGDEVPSGQDIASVSSRKRVGYIGTKEEVGRGGGGGSGITHRVEFSISPGSSLDGASLNEIEIEYPASVNVTPLVQACADSENARDGISPPCPGLVTAGIDGDGDGTIDAGRDASSDVGCCPDGSDPDSGDGLSTDGENVLEIQFNDNYNLNGYDTVIAEYPVGDPDAQFACENAEVDVNNNGDRDLNVCGGEETDDSDVGTVEVNVRVW